MKRLAKLITIIPLVASCLISQSVRASTVGEADALVIAPPSNVRAAQEWTCNVSSQTEKSYSSVSLVTHVRTRQPIKWLVFDTRLWTS